ncbi:MAG: quercetin 2,3-dioxygenase [Ignavibacteriae bacterium HGW-Ignavibacteriae-3]|nr:MAG: quercetin 2,3-dioxygenase [Ignavibacteriae bacterium HGW-Ignavibacteriae-3]
MIELRKSSERGKTKIDWLESYHSFSFGEYYDPGNTHFGPLRVMNDDIIQPGAGFPTHPHRDMEIVTIVFEGAVAHKDSSGGNGIITVNEVQRMTAGSGIRHSEFNASDTEILKLLQVWLIPVKQGLEPSYDQKKFSHQEKNNRLLKIVSGSEEEGTLFINQDAEIYLSDLEKGKEIKHPLKKERGLYLHLVEGAISAGGKILSPGDAVKITDEESLNISASEDSKLILFDLNMNF